MSFGSKRVLGVRASSSGAQLPLFESWNGVAAPAPVGVDGSRGTRLIHYLGSKLRLRGPIVELMNELCEPGGVVCDLFSGSGAVSAAVARSRKVVAVDIQEYARVIAAGLFTRPAAADADELMARSRTDPRAIALADAVKPLVELEAQAMGDAELGAPDDLCSILEGGSLYGMRSGARPSNASLRRAAGRTTKALERAGLVGPRSLVTRYFGGLYFSWAQAAELDAILAEAQQVRNGARDFHIAAVLAAASDIVNTVGKQFAQPIKPRDGDGAVKVHLVHQVLRDRRMDVRATFAHAVQRLRDAGPGTRGHRAHRADYRDFLTNSKTRFEAVYADPPYTRDHYSRYYHVLETMALYDEPLVSKTRIRAEDGERMSRGLYRLDRHQSPFSIHSQAPEAFDALFRLVAARRVPLAVSYSGWNATAGHRPRMLTLDQLDAIARRYYRHVEIRSVKGIRHNKFNLEHRNVEINSDVEQICVCRP